MSKKLFNLENVVFQIRELGKDANQYNEYRSWGSKQDLYLLKDLIDEMISNSPNFGELEDQWLKTKEQQRIIKILKQR